MTRKDYILIAEALYAARPPGLSPITRDVYVTVVQSVAAALACDNPRFDRERFLKACGVQS